ncbi:outer membrane protein OmpA-like peptidoglycan-associated protein [Advenella incenata]|uniref:Outer membrane protein OmpA-like peptidoglycan-associated protein n=1 Tax=Advenella incenata TaxID=267800 RepID=A0A4Q7VTZ8_9BURK|nr:OmpA family protein [Advenella incenata]RZU00092.1 outer membrane protein OmpA-like peptidoglycan-associated protein [Advenella incenata]
MKLSAFTRATVIATAGLLLTACASFGNGGADNPGGGIAVDTSGLPVTQRSVTTPSNWNELIGQIRASDTQNLGIQVNRVRDGSLRVILPGGTTFRGGSARLNNKMKPVLNAVAGAFTQSPYLRIKVVGHSDSQGDSVTNQTLSITRATAVANYLIQRNVKSVLIELEGRGSIDPLMSNTTAQGRAVNRRVELYLYEIR